MDVEMRLLPTDVRGFGVFQIAASQVFRCVVTTLGGGSVVRFGGRR